MRAFTNNDTLTCKGFAILLMLFHHLFFMKEVVEFFGVSPILISQGSLISIALDCKICFPIFVFLTGFGFSRFINRYNISSWTSGFSSQCVLFRYIKLIFPFLFIYILSVITTFLYSLQGSEYYSLGTAYGTDQIRYLISRMAIDAAGLAWFFKTPTLNATWWYVSLATCFIFFLPLCLAGWRKFGIAWFGCLILAPRILFGLSDANADLFLVYLPTLMCGIYCAETNFFEKMASIPLFKGRQKDSAIKFVLCITIFSLSLWLRRKYPYDEITNIPVAMAISLFCYLFVCKIKYLYSCLAFLGIHSMNMFLTHTLVYGYYFPKFFYSFKYPLIIFIPLVVASLLVSIAIEYIKKIIDFNKIKNNILRKYCPLMYPSTPLHQEKTFVSRSMDGHVPADDNRHA